MNLPELSLQIVYGRLAWAVVIAALACVLWPARWRLPRRTVALLLLATAALQMLPGEASPGYWLGLAIQWPSATLVGLCLVKLQWAWQGQTGQSVMTPRLAALIALAGTALYLDAIGLLSLGLYYWGFGPYLAPVLALLLGVACCAAALAGRARAQALAMLFALAVFAVLRLPTGNLWDALLDPLVWAWALYVAGRRARQVWLLQRRPQLINATD